MIYQPTPDKRCTKCGESFPATTEYFHIKRHGLYGVGAVCKPCYSVHYTRPNQSKATARVKAWRLANPERNKAIERRHRIQHSDRLKDNQRRCRAKHPDKYRERVQRCRHAKPDLYRSFKHKRRAREMAVLATFSQPDWKFALRYFDYRCAICGNQTRKLAQDHWVPVALGGAYAPDNILPLCHGKGGCNTIKNDSDPLEWLFTAYNHERAHEILACIEAYFELVRVLSHG